MESNKKFHIGCQSWQYDDWVTKPGGDKIFYPRGTKTTEMLTLYSEIFDTIEVDSTAYGTPATTTLEGWAESTPDGFLFSLKTPRAITHEFSLGPLSFGIMDEFVDVVRALGPHLGVILIQLPASFESTTENGKNLRSFIARLPSDLRFAVEFRHPGWFVDWTFDELNERRIALSLVAGKWIEQDVVFNAFAKTVTPFAYLRFMGIRDLPSFDSVYRERKSEIERWARMMNSLAAEEVFVYVDNYFEGHAPSTANTLKRSLGLPVNEPKLLDPQASLF
jgi:uncharacterized protein YecE (DUF72 family)